MPIYAYRCESCGFAKDVLQKISDPHLTTCPKCGKDTFRKQLTAACFLLKGSGWYATDFRGCDRGGADMGKDAAALTKASEASPSGDSAPAAACANCPARANASDASPS